MRGKPEHDQVRIQPMQDMVLIRIVARLSPLSPNEVHDLVLPLAGFARIRQDYLSVGAPNSASVFINPEGTGPRHGQK